MAASELKGAFVEGTSFAAVNVATPIAAGQLGKIVEPLPGVKYQYVQFASTGTAYAANQVVSWKTRSSFIVSNKSNTDAGSQNELAGVCLGVMTAGNYGWIQIKGNAVTVKFGGVAPAAAGDTIVGKSATDAGDTDKVAAGTAPVSKVVGIATAASGAGKVTVDLDLTSGGF